jgi:hypothetical protein
MGRHGCGGDCNGYHFEQCRYTDTWVEEAVTAAGGLCCNQSVML